MRVECFTHWELLAWQDRLHHRRGVPADIPASHYRPLPTRSIPSVSLTEASEKLKVASLSVEILRQEPPGMFSRLYRLACRSRREWLEAYRIARALDDAPRQKSLFEFMNE